MSVPKLASHSPCNEEFGRLLGVVGSILLAGYAAHVLGRRTHVPRVTLHLT